MNFADMPIHSMYNGFTIRQNPDYRYSGSKYYARNSRGKTLQADTLDEIKRAIRSSNLSAKVGKMIFPRGF